MPIPFLNANPFAVDAWFDSSCTLTFAVPKEQVAARLPDCLEPDVFDDRWAFVAVAIVQTRKLRPAGFPAWAGSDFVLVGYRFFVRYKSASGRNLRGLYILRSETDKARMVRLGNCFTRYGYVKSGIRLTETAGRLRVEAPDTGLAIELDLTSEGSAPLPADSPFAGWEQARKFSGPLPFTFSYEREKRRVVIVEGVRSHWKPQPVRVLSHHIPFLADLGLANAVLANAFVVRDIPYRWRAGRTETWTPT